ncbi:MAG: acyl carrier protein [Clostridium perfringens]|nr:acyl carrier protein [Clostridium perfringens]MDU3195996.1 acyl carrier protein [Clostridium perfringens]MDU3867027.1 acyl carrier protein [Clostridium perfringens]MDU6350760.1 acyl carrier protein [Clostridium perfringens]
MNSDIMKRVINILSNNERFKSSEVNYDLNLIKDLGFDSLDIMKFIVELEDEFNIMFEPEELEYENIINIKNLCDLISSKII